MIRLASLASLASAMVLGLAAPALAGSVTYTYDEQGRISTASYSDGTLICYGYDAAGNRVGYGVGSSCSAKPVTGPVSATVTENTTNNPIPVSVSTGVPSTLAVSTAPAHGTTAISGLSITYTPTAGYVGSDSFAYTATNTGGTSTPGTASITVKFAPVTHTYGGSGTETVPLGATTVTVTMWSGGGGGGRDSQNGAGGGGGGCQAIKTIAVISGNTFTYNIGNGTAGLSTNGTGPTGNPSTVSGTVSGGTVSLTTSTRAGGGISGPIGGVGAVCAGGTTNTAGNHGGLTSGGTGGGVGGGAGGVGLGGLGTVPGGGGGGAIGGTSGGGAGGQVMFSYQ